MLKDDEQDINLPEKEILQEEIAHDTGVFSCTKKGFGFIRPDDESSDLFVAARNKKDAFHKDRVRFEVIREETEDQNREAVIVEVLERSFTELVGTYIEAGKFGFVKPDIANIGSDIFVPGKKSMNAKNDDKVLVSMVNYGGGEKRPEGKIVEILGRKGEPGVDILSVIRGRGVPVEFSREALDKAKQLPDIVSENETKGREDYRDVLTVTIDGEHTKDFDDAVSLVKEGNIYRLGIHIADVTHYVKQGDAIDKDAVIRGTSVYPVDRVVPMIPEKLSVGICSLVQGDDRLTLSCIMDFDEKGNMLDSHIAETVINVDRRMTYTEVAGILEDPEANKEKYADVIPMLIDMKKLTDMFREQKKKRGAIDFEIPEPDITLDEKGHPLEIKLRERDDATMIIEELMLKANETVARTVTLSEAWKDVPLVYRSHERPDEDRIEYLRNLVWSLGHKFNVDLKNVKPTDIQELLKSVEGTKEEQLITTVTLRCMKRAMYSTADRVVEDGKPDSWHVEGHFGLAADYYCHFTSPIRRYPDLINHRIIKRQLHGKLSEKDIHDLRKNLPELAQHICETEHRAIDTERDSNRIKMAEFMKEREGQVFDGTVSSFAAWGIYITLPNAIEGMVPISSLEDGYYVFDEENMVMRREDGGRVFRIGDEVKVKVTMADPELRIIDFEFV